MTEKSWFWRGLVVGDAVSSKYDSATLAELWRKLFTTARTEEGVIADSGNELEPTYTVTKSKINTGSALVDGRLYSNEDSIDKQDFGGSDETQRYWRNVLRGSLNINYIRTSVSGPGDTAYLDLTQIDGEVWEIPLSKYITVAGEITELTDERVFAKSPLCQFINYRQGGSALYWAGTGSDKHLPGMPKIFAGTHTSAAGSAACVVNFPVEFLAPPIVYTTCVNSSMTHVRATISNITTTQWLGFTRDGYNNLDAVTRVFWLAIGPVA